MILTEHNIAHYLLDKSLIDLPSLVSGRFTARRSDSRHNNFIINREFDDHAYFVKQVKAQEAEKIETLRTEAACYTLAQTGERYPALNAFLPPFFHYDNRNNILITGQVKEAVTLYEYYFQQATWDDTIPGRLADALASFHTTPRQGFIPDSTATPFKHQKPWVLGIATMPAAAWPQNGQTAEYQTLQMVQQNPELVSLVSAVSQEWQAHSLTHNDAKFNNLLLGPQADDKEAGFLKLIDWELADIGDPLWDAATILQNYLSLWLNTDVPEAASQPGMKKISLQQAQACINRFWGRYAQQMNWGEAALLKAVRYCAVKLIHASFEAAPMAPTLQPLAVKMLQMSLNILRSPGNAAARLMGIQTTTHQHEAKYQYS